MSDDLWKAVHTLNSGLISLAQALLPLVNDPKTLRKLEPLQDKVREVGELLAQHYKRGPEPSGPSVADLHDLVCEIAETVDEHTETFERHEHERSRPVHVTLVKEQQQ